ERPTRWSSGGCGRRYVPSVGDETGRLLAPVVGVLLWRSHWLLAPASHLLLGDDDGLSPGSFPGLENRYWKCGCRLMKQRSFGMDFDVFGGSVFRICSRLGPI
ncbi:hypothetical protein HID58_086456, partial [Brassica napus]